MKLEEYKKKIKNWVRYVDDILIIWKGKDEELNLFLEKLYNTEESGSLKFKMEIGGNVISFLDLNLNITESNELKFDIYRKSTCTDVIIPKDSYHALQYKMAAINKFCYRVTQRVDDEENKRKEISRMKLIVNNNKYSTNIVDNMLEKIKRN